MRVRVCVRLRGARRAAVRLSLRAACVAACGVCCGAHQHGLLARVLRGVRVAARRQHGAALAPCVHAAHSGSAARIWPVVNLSMIQAPNSGVDRSTACPRRPAAMHGRGRGGPYVPADHRVQTMLAAQERQQQNVAAVKARTAPRPGAALPQHSWPPSALRSAISRRRCSAGGCADGAPARRGAFARMGDSGRWKPRGCPRPARWWHA
jgi:hypothetical protein